MAHEQLGQVARTQVHANPLGLRGHRGAVKFLPTKPGKTHLGLEEAHRDLHISPAEFDEVAAELGGSLDFAKVPAREKAEVLAAFAAHKDEANLEVEGDLTIHGVTRKVTF
jgi:polyisoprenoid-binding protein YceI